MKIGSIVRFCPDIRVPIGDRVFGITIKATETTGVKDVLVFWLGAEVRTFEWIFAVNIEEVV